MTRALMKGDLPRVWRLFTSPSWNRPIPHLGRLTGLRCSYFGLHDFSQFAGIQQETGQFEIAGRRLGAEKAASDPRALALRGRLASLAGDQEKAIQFFDEAIRGDRSNGFAVAWKAQSLLLSSSYAAGSAEFWNLSSESRTPWAHVWRGCGLLAAGDFEAAERAQSTALKTERDNLPARLLRGLARKGLGNHGAAGADFRAAVDLDPGCPGFRILLGQALAETDKEAAAADEMDAAAQRAPDCMDALIYLLDKAEKRLPRAGFSQLDRATLDSLARRIAREPDCWWALALRGSHGRSFAIKDMASEHLKRERDLERAIELRPRAGWIKAQMGRLHWGEDQRAGLAWLERAIKASPGSGWIRAWRAELKAKLGDPAGAERDFAAGFRLTPHYYPLAYTWRGMQRLKRNRLRQAEEDFGKAIALDPRHGLAYECRCQVRRRLGLIEEAVADLTQAAMIYPEKPQSFCPPGAGGGGAELLAACRELARLSTRQPASVLPSLWLGEVLLRLGRTREAVQQLGRFIAWAQAPRQTGTNPNPLLAWALRWRGDAMKP